MVLKNAAIVAILACFDLLVIRVIDPLVLANTAAMDAPRLIPASVSPYVSTTLLVTAHLFAAWFVAREGSNTIRSWLAAIAATALTFGLSRLAAFGVLSVSQPAASVLASDFGIAVVTVLVSTMTVLFALWLRGGMRAAITRAAGLTSAST